MSLLTMRRMSEELPSGQAGETSAFEETPNCGVRPTPGKAMSVGSPSPRPSKPGSPSSQQSAAETACAPAPRRLWEARWTCSTASSGAPT